MDWARRARDGEAQPTDSATWLEKPHQGQPISRTKDYLIFDDDGEVIVLITCFYPRSESIALNAYCRGHMHDRESGAVIYILFPYILGQKDFDEYWRGPVGMVREKIAEWTISEAEMGQ